MKLGENQSLSLGWLIRIFHILLFFSNKFQVKALAHQLTDVEERNVTLVAYEEPKKKKEEIYFLFLGWGGGECSEEFEAAGLTWR